jgi:serine/threonine-protein kinase RsbW
MRTDFIQPHLIPERAANAGALINGGIEKLKVVIAADVAALEKVGACVNEFLASRQWPVQEVMKVELAVQEALANAIRHGCRNDASKLVDCCVTLSAAEVEIVIRDPGPGFDVGAVANPLERANLFKPGGRGVFLINQLMDTVEFTERGRRVTMRKRRGGPIAVA